MRHLVYRIVRSALSSVYGLTASVVSGAITTVLNGTLKLTGSLSWASSAGAGAAADVFLVRDAANILSQRNGTAAQIFAVYNTYTDASNYEYGYMGWSGNFFVIKPTRGGTGTARAIVIGGEGIYFQDFNGSTNWWFVTTAGHITAVADNTYDIGASGATRPRTVYVGTSLNSAGNVHAYSGTAIPAGGTAGAGLRVSSTSNFGVFFGSGAPTLAAAKGSLYLRSDGSGTGDRAYINTDGSTTWTALTTAA